MSRAHASVRQVIQHSESINLEQMGRYLEVLLSKKENCRSAEWEVVSDYLVKVIDGINDHVDAEAEDLEIPERRYCERLELDRAIERVAS